MPYEILSWATIAEKYRGTVFLGNGASISVSPTFSYRSLLEHAVEEQLLAADVQQIFDFFGTEDFELILRIVWQAANVNRSLGIADERTRAAYLAVRDALIRAVQNIHPEYDDVAAHLPAICQFLKNFDTVISLNYDLLLYWAMMHGFNAPDRHEFKDCFLAGEFSEDWQKVERADSRRRIDHACVLPAWKPYSLQRQARTGRQDTWPRQSPARSNTASLAK
jgi:hypothetical protein